MSTPVYIKTRSNLNVMSSSLFVIYLWVYLLNLCHHYFTILLLLLFILHHPFPSPYFLKFLPKRLSTGKLVFGLPPYFTLNTTGPLFLENYYLYRSRLWVLRYSSSLFYRLFIGTHSSVIPRPMTRFPLPLGNLKHVSSHFIRLNITFSGENDNLPLSWKTPWVIFVSRFISHYNWTYFQPRSFPNSLPIWVPYKISFTTVSKW